MGNLPTASHRWLGGLALLLSAAVHLVAMQMALARPRFERYFDDSRILPALYLYAHDRLPSEPRESRLPTAAPLGVESGTVRQVAAIGFEDHTPAPTPRLRGLAPPGPDATGMDSVFSVLAVDSVVTRVDESAAPVYPSAMLAGGVEGSVEAEFVVDTTGWVDMESVKILNSTHQEFSSSVRLALMGMQFRPAWRGARRVRQLVNQRFRFRLNRAQPPSTS